MHTVMPELNTEIKDTHVVNKASGRLAAEEFVSFISGHIDQWAGKAVLWDISDLDLTEVASDDLRNYAHDTAAIVEVNRAGERTAIYAPHDLQFGMAKAYTAFAENAAISIRYEVFRDIDEAMVWLNES